VQELIASQGINDPVRGELSKQDLVTLAEESMQSWRAVLADERVRLARELAQLQKQRRSP
jgi:hypothetical protein